MLSDMMINRRRVYGGKKLPYDAEIEYLEANGTQYIRTDYFPNHNTKIEAKGRYTHAGNIDSNNYMHFLLGARDSTTYSYQVSTDILFNYLGANNCDNTMIFGKSKSEYFVVNLRFQDLEFVLSKDGGYINGVKRFSGNDGLEFQCNYPLFLLWCNMNGTGKADKFPYGRIYFCKIYENDTLIRDFIPVRVGTTGYMYDKVSKQLFGNAGTGEFILGPDKHKEFVDLGLPSRTLWAEGNIIKDANSLYAIGKPTDKGCYFSWGNIDGHNEGEEYDFSQDAYNTTPGATLTGNILPTDAEHDAAVARLGGWCHIPTKDQFVELCNSDYTDIKGSTQDGVHGLIITSKINGNSIFLPESGFYNGTTLYSNGTYWSSTFNNERNAYYLFFLSDTTVPTADVYRCWGLTVRPVISG